MSFSEAHKDAVAQSIVTDRADSDRAVQEDADGFAKTDPYLMSVLSVKTVDLTSESTDTRSGSSDSSGPDSEDKYDPDGLRAVLLDWSSEDEAEEGNWFQAQVDEIAAQHRRQLLSVEKDILTRNIACLQQRAQKQFIAEINGRCSGSYAAVPVASFHDPKGGPYQPSHAPAAKYYRREMKRLQEKLDWLCGTQHSAFLSGAFSA